MTDKSAALRVSEDRDEARFDDYKPEFSDREAMVEANRCLYCEDAPCITACPTSIDIPTFIRKIATENVWGSAKTIFDSNILGMSCARVCPVEVLCQGDCVFNNMEEPPIQIGKLQRFATDRAFEAGWRYYEAGPDSGKSVGLLGAGPASLAAAHELRRQGHACTIYEKRDVVGGLNTTGVAPYKMRADRSVTEAEWVLGIGGIEIKTGVEVGKDITWDELEKQHDALFIGFGLGPDRFLKVDGEDKEGVHGAVDFIEAFKLGKVSLDGAQKALIIGGGNTAIDAVREVKGLGVPSVEMVYRGTEEKMSGYAHEWKAAKTEGCTGRFHALPTAYLGDGKVTGARLIALDADKQPIAGSEYEVECDLVLVAVGQGKLGELVSDLDGVEVEWGCIVTDDNGQTGRRNVFAGGDCRNGGKEVVNAAAEGKQAAMAIDAFLKGGN